MQHFRNRAYTNGFALPTILISSIVMLTVLLFSVSSTTAIRDSVQNQYYQQLAQTAGEAGVAYAEACLNANGGVPQWSNASPLQPNTDCSGTPLVSCPTTSTNALCSVSLNGNVRASFSIGLPPIESPSVLVVAGGGAGGTSAASSGGGGGGGAGGYLYNGSYALSTGTYPVTVGAGGSAATTANAQGGNGSNSTFGSLNTVGGGGGGGSQGPGAAVGGSGGGAGYLSYTYQAGAAGTTGQGNSGGNTLSNNNGGGGGGAGGAGGNTNSGGPSGSGGLGGPGLANSISGNSVIYAKGGEGGSPPSGFANGAPNSGNGASGIYGTTTASGIGGSGVVILKYPTGLITATGGTITTSGNYTIQTFTSSGNFTISAVNSGINTIPNTGFVQVLRTSNSSVWRTYQQTQAPPAFVPDLCSGAASSIYGWQNAVVTGSASVQSLAVGGGGSGGGSTGGGGGAGGFVYNASTSITTGNYPIVVGAGGAGTAQQSPGLDGGDSSFNGITAIGGGGGGYSTGTPAGSPGLSGGSGGGGQNYNGATVGASGASGNGIYGQGNSGGLLGVAAGSGGGGAGGLGSAGTTTSQGGAGGIGMPSSISGSALYYAGGGGGGAGNGAGGLGGGGPGGSAAGYAGGNNTGGGGGGGWDYSGGSGGAGGSGVVIISYPTGSITATGGTTTTSGANTIQTFTGSGTFSVTSVSGAKAVARSISLAAGLINPGPLFLRKDFSVTQAGAYTTNLSTDSHADVYFDGRLITSTNAAPASVSTTISAGCHTMIVALVNSGILPSIADLTLSITKQGATLPIVVTDTSWRATAGNSVNFSSPNYYADPTAWTSIRDINAASTVGASWVSTSGDSTARWIGASHHYDSAGNYPSAQYALFRDNKVITVTTPTQVKLSYLCDDSCSIYLDGNVVATGNLSSINTTTLTLSQGQHSFGVASYNISGPSGFAFAAVRTADNIALTTTDATWVAATFWSSTNQNPNSYDATYTPNPAPSTTTTVQVLASGGGGGGGANMGGGGGGGGVVYNSSYKLGVGTMNVTVGAGGAGAPPGYGSHPSIPGANGRNSVFGTVIAFGGGHGGTSYNTLGYGAINVGANGSSGGGASGYNNNGAAVGATLGGLGISGQGYNGGAQGVAYYSGGGGGAGGAGSSGNSQANGGPGTANSILGTSYYWGGGGGGSGYSIGGGNGGIGGGGGGAIGVTTGGGSALNAGSPGTNGCTSCQANVPGGNGGVNSGGGGGGGSHYLSTNKGGDGGSGIVVISFPTGSLTATAIGATITTSAGNTIYSFTSSGTFTVISIP
jgi:hypothetical protein